MSLFGNLGTDNTEAVEDRLGGFSAKDTDIYTGKIKLAYATESSGGARGVTLIVAGGDFGDQEYRETIYVTSGKAKGQTNTYEKDGKKYLLPGYITMDHICLATVGTPLNEIGHEEKTVKVYDAEAGKEVPKSVPVLTPLLGQDITLAIVKNLENKSVKQGDKYVPTNDTRETNNIDKVFNTETKMTVSEARAGSETAEFHDKWLERNKGKTRDKTEKVAGQGGNAGGPPRSGGGGNAGGSSGGDASPRSSLFNKK